MFLKKTSKNEYGYEPIQVPNKPERRRLVNAFKLSRISDEILKFMEKEGLNIAEAEVLPEFLANRIKENSERNLKGKPFTVFKED